MKEIIKTKLINELSPDYIEIVNESQFHAGHNGFDGSGESHFRIKISSQALNDISKLKAHKTIYKILSQEMQTIHALAIEIQK